jgi:hypothetical protein
MAKLSPESKQLIINLKNRLLDIVDESKAVEFAILNRFGETAETLDSLEQLTEIALQAESRFSQLSNLEIRAAQSQPIISPDLLRFIEEVIKTTQVRIPALMRSVEEIKLEWS